MSAVPTARFAVPLASALLASALLAAAGLAGCPDTSQLCPSYAREEGAYNTTLAQQDGGADDGHPLCRVILADGGSSDASIGNANQTFTADLCSSNDAGPLLFLALPGVVRQSVIGDGGTFHFDNGDGGTVLQGTVCNCDIQVQEKIEGTLTPAVADAGPVLIDDGGLTPIASFSGTVTDLVGYAGPASDGGNGCTCNVPCSLVFTMTGIHQ
jgi:hypothetical protein